ncbi:amino acid adenylation domain-containing protein, partial [Streptomyces sp. LBUM 1476]|nr:amino acid adenylation domain-containing protein [Streptomyces sp. LBUM 1476]
GWPRRSSSTVPYGWKETSHDDAGRSVPRERGACARRGGVAGRGEEVTYAELDARSDRVARVLAGSGWGPGLVGAVVGRCVESVVTVLGILKSGAAYVRWTPAYPAERLRYVVADAGVRVSVGPRAREVRAWCCSRRAR